jgi:hypothetical protein
MWIVILFIAVKRRLKRTLESIAYLNKLEDLLGLNELITGKINVLKKDNQLFQRHYDSTSKSEKDPKTGKVIKGEDIKTVDEYIGYWMYTDNMYTAEASIYCLRKYRRVSGYCFLTTYNFLNSSIRLNVCIQCQNISDILKASSKPLSDGIYEILLGIYAMISTMHKSMLVHE